MNVNFMASASLRGMYPRDESVRYIRCSLVRFRSPVENLALSYKKISRPRDCKLAIKNSNFAIVNSILAFPYYGEEML